MTKTTKSKTASVFENFPLYILIALACSLITTSVCVFYNQSVKPVTISSYLEKSNKGNTEYIVNIAMPDGKLNPIIIENVWWLFRFDRTTTYAELVQMNKTNPGQKYCVSVYGIRIPSISYQGLTSIKPIEKCK
jgi:hypothetical protein